VSRVEGPRGAVEAGLLAGRKGIGPRLALKLEAAGMGPARFWLAMQMQYDLHRVRSLIEGGSE